MNRNKENRSKLLGNWLKKSKKSSEKTSKTKVKTGPLSSGQERLYFLQSIAPHSAFYHYAEHYTFKGNYDLNRLISSFQKTVKCFDILNTAIVEDESGITQKFIPELEPEIIRKKTSIQDQQEFLSLSKEIANKPFNLELDSLVRLLVVERDENQVDLLVIMHHIITDKWSMEILRKHWVKFYANEEYVFKEDVSYLSYAHDKRDRKVPDHSLNYWTSLLSNHKEISLETTGARHDNELHTGSFYKTFLPESISAELRKFCLEESVSAYSFYLAVFLLFLHKHSDSNSVCIGTPISTRDSEKFQEMIGFFNETMIINQDFLNINSFAELVHSVSDQFLNNLKHIDVPFEKIVREVSDTRQGHDNPLFNHMFLFHTKTQPPSFHEDFNYKFETFNLGVAKFDLTFYIAESQNESELIVEYDDVLFSSDQVQSFAQHYSNLVIECLKHPNQDVQLLNILQLNELEELQIIGKGPKIPWEFESILDKISFHSNSSAVALSDGEESISYIQVEKKTRLLAGFIQRNEIYNQGIGLYCEAGINQIIGVLAILRSGNFYVPLDPAYPLNRIKLYSTEAGLSIILDVSNNPYPIEEGQTTVISLDKILQQDNYQNLYRPIDISEEDPAYLIFTSGSSGKPKGVRVSHGTLAHSTAARYHYYRNQPSAFLLMSSFAFDSSIAGIFWTLSSGGKLVLTKSRAEQDVLKLAELIDTEKISHTLLLPSLYGIILTMSPSSRLKSLNTVIVAGEAAGSSLIRDHHSILPNCALYNEYGPTECTVWATVDELKDQSKVTIGKPIMNTAIYLIKAGSLAKRGQIGEIHIGGMNLVGSYHNNSSLSKEKFVTLSHISNSTLYRTGDLGKWDDEGKLIFLGRKDHQIKLRGHRIELDEIQSVISNLESIKRSEIRVFDSNNPRIIAFYTGLQDSSLETHIENELPNYMIPSLFIHIKEFRFLPNGKLDEKHLEKIYSERGSIKIEQAKNTTWKESQMLDIWKSVLKLETIDIDENFFRIGGDSMLSIRLLSEGRKRGISWKPQDIFSFQSIRELSQHATWSKSEQVQGRYSGNAKFLPIHDWFFKTHKNAPYHWGHCYVIHLEQKIELSQLQATLNSFFNYHPELSAYFDVEAGVISFQSYKSEAEAINSSDLEKAILRCAKSWESNPNQALFKTFLLEDSNSIALYAHHLLVDKYSWDLLLEDFELLLLGQKDSNSNIDFVKTHSILDWSDFLNNQAAEQFAWNEFVINKDSSSAINDKELLEKDFHSESLTISIPILNQLNSNTNLSIETVLLGIFNLALGKIKNTEELVFELEHMGRNHDASQLDLSRAVGWFSSTHPIGFNSSQDPRDLLNYWKELNDKIEGINNNGLGFGLLIQKSDKVERNDRHSWILFNYMGESTSKKNIEFHTKGVRNPLSERSNLLEVVAAKSKENIIFSIFFHPSYMNSNELGMLKEELQQIASTIKPEHLTLNMDSNDYDNSGLSQESLDHLSDLF